MQPINDPTLSLLLRCCRHSFGPDQMVAVEALVGSCRIDKSLDWPLLYQLANHHGVAPLVFKNLQHIGVASMGIPPTVVDDFQTATYQSIAVKAGVRKKLTELAHFCAARDLRVMVIKGTALDLTVYHEPWYVNHDIDLVFDQPQNRLSTQVYQELDHYFWDLPGFEYDFYAHHDVTMNGLLPVDFGAIWAAAQPFDLDGATLWLMCPTDMLLAAAINSCRKRYFRLKSLVALATLVESYPTLDWHLLFDKAHRYRCSAILYAALMVTERTIGCNLPEDLSTALKLSATRCWLIERLIEQHAEYALLQGAQPFSPIAPPVDRTLLLPYSTYTLTQIRRRLRKSLRPAKAEST